MRPSLLTKIYQGDPNSALGTDSYSRGGLSGFETELSSPQEGEDLSLDNLRSSPNLSPPLGTEDGVSVGESNNGSVLSRLMWMSRGSRTNPSAGLSLGPSVEYESSL